MTNPQRKLLFRLSDQKGRVTIASLIAIVAYLLAFPFETGLRIALAYVLAVFTFLAMQAYRISGITAQDIQDYYQDREPSSIFVVIAAVIFSSLSMAGVGLCADISEELDSAPRERPHSPLSARNRAVLDPPPRFLRVLLRPFILRR